MTDGTIWAVWSHIERQTWTCLESPVELKRAAGHCYYPKLKWLYANYRQSLESKICNWKRLSCFAWMNKFRQCLAQNTQSFGKPVVQVCVIKGRDENAKSGICKVCLLFLDLSDVKHLLWSLSKHFTLLQRSV